MKEISLTHKQFALVDDEDYAFWSQWSWFAVFNKSSKTYYAAHTVIGDEFKIFGNIKTALLHRVIMKTPNKMLCDHIDHNTLNNQKYNLRNVTQAQNQMNRRGPQANNKTGVLGVQTTGKRFFAFIFVDGKEVRFPARSTIEEAIRDRKEAEIKYYGEYRSAK